MALARRLGLLSFDAYHAGNAIAAAERLGEWAWARDAIGALVEAHPDGGERDWIATCAEWTDVWTGDPDPARVERLRAHALEQHDAQMQLNTESWLARHAFAAGRIADAVRAAETHFRFILSDSSEFAMAARFALHAGRLDLARQTLEAARNESGSLVDHDLANVRAGIAASEGRTADGLALYKSALAGYREMGCRFDFALTVLDMAVLIGLGEPAVRAAIPEGREILRSLGALTLLERLDALDPEDASSTSPTAPMGSPTEALRER
jgi:hypothetical protein